MKKQEKRSLELKELLLRGPRMSYDEAIRQIGPNNLPTIYDLSKMRKFFCDSEGLDKFQDDIEIKDKRLLAKKFRGVVFGSHLSNPDSLYIWTGEYLGFAPDNHPAKGKIILSKIESIEMEKSIPGLFGVISSPVFGAIILSKKDYVITKNILEGHLFHITNFEEQKKFMVPILKTEYSRATDVNEKVDTGYGMLSTHVMLGRNPDNSLEPILAPMCMRPSTHMNMGFVTGHTNLELKAIDRNGLVEILES